MNGESASIGSFSLRISAAKSNCGDEHDTARALRPELGEGLRDDAAERVADDSGFLDRERIEEQFDVVGEVEPRVAAFRLARRAVAPNVDQDQVELLRKIGHERHPVARAVRVAMNEHHRRSPRGTHLDVSEGLAVRQRHGLLHCIERVEVDLQGGRGGLGAAYLACRRDGEPQRAAECAKCGRKAPGPRSGWYIHVREITRCGAESAWGRRITA
jgi:hypothetical protein